MAAIGSHPASFVGLHCLWGLHGRLLAGGNPWDGGAQGVARHPQGAGAGHVAFRLPDVQQMRFGVPAQLEHAPGLVLFGTDGRN